MNNRSQIAYCGEDTFKYEKGKAGRTKYYSVQLEFEVSI